MVIARRRGVLGVLAIVIASAGAGAAACQGQGQEPGGAPSKTASPAEDARAAGPRAEEPPPADDTRARPEESEEPIDPNKRIHELGAISAWRAVVDRAQLLARRGQRGVVYGRVGPVVLVPDPDPAPVDAGVRIDAGLVPSPYVWIVDDTTGNGSLGIRARLDGRAQEGDRVALGGAWDLDAARTWYWRVDAVEPLPPAPPSDLADPPAPVPSHVIATGPPPAGTRPIALAKDGELVSFQIVGPPPASAGDGWTVANQLGDPPVAIMNLPGDRASYGGHDLRTADERWQLRRGQTYWVRIGRLRKRTDKPALVTARTAPVRVP